MSSEDGLLSLMELYDDVTIKCFFSTFQSFLFNIEVKLLCPKEPFYSVTHLVHAYVL